MKAPWGNNYIPHPSRRFYFHFKDITIHRINATGISEAKKDNPLLFKDFTVKLAYAFRSPLGGNSKSRQHSPPF
jgi:hypothetical protein